MSEAEIIYDEIRVESRDCLGGKFIQPFFNITKFEEDVEAKTLKMTCDSKHKENHTMDVEMIQSIVTFRVKRRAKQVKVCRVLLDLIDICNVIPEDYKNPVDKTGPIRVDMDGDMWCAVRENTFVNIQESTCGFGTTPILALEQLFKRENRS